MIFDELKSIGNVLQEAGKIEQYKQILEAQKDLLEMQKKIFDLENENKDLKEKLELKEKINFDRNSYWIEKDGPFCTCCWDDSRKTVRMQPGGNPAFYSCPKCENKHIKIYPEKDLSPRAVQFTPTSYE
jgi:hypothetical protein